MEKRLISGFENDDRGTYNKMVERVLQEDTNVFAPQLLIWSVPLNGVEFNRQIIDGALRRVGSSITAVEVYAIMRVMDFFETKEYVTDFSMLGLSYGGFYTMMTAAIDTRIREHEEYKAVDIIKTGNKSYVFDIGQNISG